MNCINEVKFVDLWEIKIYFGFVGDIGGFSGFFQDFLRGLFETRPFFLV